MGWKVKRATTGYNPHPHVRYGARPTEQDGQISALKLPMSVLVFDIQDDTSGMPAFVTLNFTDEAGYRFILARPDQEDETAYVVRSCTWFPPEMPYGWLPLQDFKDLLRWKAQLKAGVGIEAVMPKKLPSIQGFYHDLHLPGPRWRFSAFEPWMLP